MKDNPEVYWNDTRHPKTIKIYQGRMLYRGMFRKGIPYDQDVRTFIRAKDTSLAIMYREVIGLSTLPEGPAPVAAVLKRIQEWVIGNVTYVGDSRSWSVPEFWQTTDETLLLKTGDCEDGAILIASLMLHAGIEPWRVRVNAGWVKAGKGAAQGGHAYAVFCDGERWYPIDWCYYPEVKSDMGQRTPLKEFPEYRDVWWSFNHQHVWSEEVSPTMSGRIKDIPAE